MLPHLRHVTELVQQRADESAATLCTNLGYHLMAVGAYAGAHPLYERALGIIEHALGVNHPDTALSLNNLAVLLDNQGEYAAARPLYERALAIYEQALGKNHPSTQQTRRSYEAMQRDAQGQQPQTETPEQ